ncbi:MAG TPA: ABC-F family ATP-binding cassette domain-containing protein [Thermoanaerobaculia bacterium]|nr:ABC-F family ATP-binding cassette domain-containing protein [Thermoanaerobaculia bacterium]
MLYRFDRIAKSYGPKEVLRDVTWQHNPGQKVGLVGRNGAGKTTLLRMVLGREEPDAGEIVRANAVRIATVEQALESDPDEPLHDFVAGAFQGLHEIEAEMRRLEHRMAEGEDTPAIHDRYDALTHRFENEGGYDMVAEVDKALSGLGFEKPEFPRPLRELSGGQKNRAMLARAILSSPDVLLLDEPTNHLDFQAVEFLEEYLARSRRAYLVVTHDRRFLDRVAEEIIDLENGRLSSYTGGYSAYRRQKAERVLAATRAFDKQQEFIEKEKEYIRRNIAGVNSRQAKGRRTKLERVERLEKPVEDGTNVAFRFDAARIGGRIFLRANHLDAGYAAGSPIVRGVSFELLRGERMAILGENGTGKTTLLKTLAGRLPALAGSAATGHDVSIGYYDQELSDLDPRKRALDAVWDLHPDETEEEVRSYLARFAFRGDDAFAKIEGLSGGEKGRLTLAVVMKQRHNLLLLDEPTNHLDLDSREALEESLEDFPGSIVFVSHDRAFIDRIATRVLDLREGRAMLLNGGYSETAEARTERRRRPEPAAAASLAAPAAPRAAAPATAPVTATAEPRPVPKPRRPDSAQEKEAAKRRRRLKALEEKIAALETEVESIETRLWEEALTLGPVAAHDLSRRKTATKEELDALVDEWARLSEEAEAAGPGKEEPSAAPSR